MRKILKKLVIKFGHVFPTSLTPKNEVQQLIQKLHPIDPGIDFVRLGPEGDGGYLVPDDFENIEACFSPGVGKISTFEKNCADLGMKVFMADFSVEKPGIDDDRFHFTKKYIGASKYDNFITMDYWVNQLCGPSKEDLLLQIDIENYEYEVFLNISDKLLQRFRIIVVEFHGLEQLWNKPFFKIASRVFHKILHTHTCVHIHPNNQGGVYTIFDVEIPRLMEFTFLRTDRLKSHAYAQNFPHFLDADTTSKPTIQLPNCWYRK